MRKPLVGLLVVLAGGWAVGAQEASLGVAAAKDTTNVAADFAAGSAAQVNLYAPREEMWSSAPATAAAPATNAAPGDPAAGAVATPRPKFVFAARDDYRWQLGLGVEFFRFQSSLIYASLVGLNTTLTYFTNNWFAVEGSVVTGFAPEIYDREHVKYLGGGGGMRIGTRQARWEPWGHVQFGGGHLQPQTAGNSRNGLAITTGGGVDFRVNERVSLRVEGDYVYTRFFSQSQNDFQAFTGVVFHF
jgi:opacity protein-like surface antigen